MTQYFADIDFLINLSSPELDALDVGLADSAGLWFIHSEKLTPEFQSMKRAISGSLLGPQMVRRYKTFEEPIENWR